MIEVKPSRNQKRRGKTAADQENKTRNTNTKCDDLYEKLEDVARVWYCMTRWQ